MGRPIKKKFFGNLNLPDYGSVSQGSGVGGEGVATIAKNNTGTLYTTSTTIGLTFTAPNITGGAAPTGRVTTNAFGQVATVTLLTAGSGYTSAPTATVTGGTTGTTATFTITLTSNRQNALSLSSYLPSASQSRTGGDIIKQESSRRYLVQNADGTGQCKLTATNTLIPGTMNIIATDYNGSTYWVTKLTAHKVRVKRRSMSTAYLVSDGVQTGWTLASATGTVVTLANT